MADDEFDIADLERRMHGAFTALKAEFSSLRTGRASSSLVEHMHIEAYGAHMPLNQMATISVPEPRMISVQVWDKGNVAAVDRAIRESDLGLNPVVDGTTLRLPIPELNEERRNELVKVAHKYAEQARIAARNVRRDGMEHLKKLEKDAHMSQDEHLAWAEDVQKLTDRTIKEIDEALGSKEAEIKQV